MKDTKDRLAKKPILGMEHRIDTKCILTIKHSLDRLDTLIIVNIVTILASIDSVSIKHRIDRLAIKDREDRKDIVSIKYMFDMFDSFTINARFARFPIFAMFDSLPINDRFDRLSIGQLMSDDLIVFLSKLSKIAHCFQQLACFLRLMQEIELTLHEWIEEGRTSP